MPSLKVAFYVGPTTWYGWAIRLWTWSKITHCELLIDDTFISAVEGTGVRQTTMPFISELRWKVVEIPVTEIELQRVKDFCNEEMGCSYDWKGIFLSQVLPLSRQHPEKWFCSEFCAAALERAGVGLGRAPHKLSPAGLYKKLKAVLPS